MQALDFQGSQGFALGALDKHGALLIPESVLAARDESMEHGIVLVALIVIVEQVKHPDRTAWPVFWSLMDAAGAVAILIIHAFRSVTEVAHDILSGSIPVSNPPFRRAASRLIAPIFRAECPVFTCSGLS